MVHLKNLVIYHHLGLGDHFICNGLVREWAAKSDSVSLFCKEHNAETVGQMYQDLRIKLLVGDDAFAENYLLALKNAEILKIGFHQLNDQQPFDQQFYSLAGVPFEKRWSSFKANRNKNKEQKLIYQLKLPPKFALLHEDQSRGYKIDRNKINLPIVRLEKKDGFTMIDWLAVAELADEVHVIDSSFLSLVDQSSVKTKLHFHKYARNALDWLTPTTKKHWTTYV